MDCDVHHAEWHTMVMSFRYGFKASMVGFAIGHNFPVTLKTAKSAPFG
jgi:hypothetical protein